MQLLEARKRSTHTILAQKGDEAMKQCTINMSDRAAAWTAKKWIRKSFLPKYAILTVFLAFATSAWSQDNASITGTATDSSGAAVVDAGISLTNTATGQVRHATSNSVGDYLFPNLGAGVYNLEATASGFQKVTTTGIVVHVAQTLQQNL